MLIRDQGICEICHELVTKDQPHFRITADAVTWAGEDEFESLIDNKCMVFSVFHAQCLEDAMNDSSADDTPYIWEARSLMGSSPLCEECMASMTKQKKVPTPAEKPIKKQSTHLKLMQGGLV